MTTQQLNIATRDSPLALWQANYVKALILAAFPTLMINLVKLKTKGDQTQDKPLTQIGGKTLFVKELQRALLDGDADIAVHCVKDMSVHPVSGLKIAAICNRGDPNDVLVSNNYNNFNTLPYGATIGTSSPRRKSLLLAMRPGLNIVPIRGNINTRLQKLDDGEYDALVLAAAGLKRLKFFNRIADYLPRTHFVPAIGQGALGIECRCDDPAIESMVQHLNNPKVQTCIIAEQVVNRVLKGDCHTPIGACASFQKNETRLHLEAMVASLDGQTILRSSHTIDAKHSPQDLGTTVAEDLLAQGAADLLG